MYKTQIHPQLIFADFDQFIGLKTTLENRWIKKVARIPCAELEVK
ncbi:hypothetical protein [Enterococcus lemanii]|uniref:Uncharacterized protein n=1 Tax=Enterococcus lemanii TaxID=1159752 RepID=A0ABV9MVP3_9ENTE|nr:hypothetical protein [Enterococcus lemanii]MBM7710162.1 hypothetical protein [Enterococcus lemanii]